VCFVFSRLFATSAPTCQKTKQKKAMEVHEWLGHRVIGLFFGLVFVWFYGRFYYRRNITKGQGPLSMSTQPHLMDIIQVRIFLLIFSWCGHLPRKLLETMGGNTAQPRLENRISKQISACFFQSEILQYMPCAAICVQRI
jgi:hypothetical protein